MISSTWLGTKVGRLEGIRAAKEIGFDTYDVFDDPRPDGRGSRGDQATCDEVGLPVARSSACAGVVDFNSSVQRFTYDRIKAYVDQGAYLGARNVLLVVGEYYWDGEVIPNEAIWGPGEGGGQTAVSAGSKGLEIVLELEPFETALLKDVDELVRFVREIDHPAVRRTPHRTCTLERSFEDVKKLTGLIGHIHLPTATARFTVTCPPAWG
jgi:sugar phosphate isomerase/epimerase